MLIFELNQHFLLIFSDGFFFYFNNLVGDFEWIDLGISENEAIGIVKVASQRGGFEGTNQTHHSIVNGKSSKLVYYISAEFLMLMLIPLLLFML